MAFIITADWIHANGSSRNAWTKAQLAVLGVPWPPPQGWLSNLVGQEISDARKHEFEQMRGHKRFDFRPMWDR